MACRKILIWIEVTAGKKNTHQLGEFPTHPTKTYWHHQNPINISYTISFKYCGWLRNPAPPKGWLKPNNGINHLSTIYNEMINPIMVGYLDVFQRILFSWHLGKFCRRLPGIARHLGWMQIFAEPTGGQTGQWPGRWFSRWFINIQGAQTNLNWDWKHMRILKNTENEWTWYIDR